MGDRANIAVNTGLAKSPHHPGGAVVLYTHWAGTEAPVTLQNALKIARKGDRLRVASYLARIVFCEMVSEEKPGETTGYGISTDIGDNEHHILLLDGESTPAMVHLFDRKIEDNLFNLEDNKKPPKPMKSWTVDEYLELELTERDSFSVLTGEPDEDDE